MSENCVELVINVQLQWSFIGLITSPCIKTIIPRLNLPVFDRKCIPVFDRALKTCTHICTIKRLWNLHLRKCLKGVWSLFKEGHWKGFDCILNSNSLNMFESACMYNCTQAGD